MNKSYQYLLKLIKPSDTIVVGVSAGPDSMCLLHILLEIKKRKNINIIVAHINHNVREASFEEEAYLKDYCSQYNIPIEVLKLEKISTNFEAVARKKRYEFYQQIVNKYHARYLMTAHHGDDLIETILMRELRGSNLKGYAGFKKYTEYPNYALVRPLIYCTKKELEQYLEQNNIKYYIDATNLEDNHLRNRIRHHILPLLKAENPQVHEKFLEFSEELTVADNILQKYTNDILRRVYNNNRLNIKELQKENKVIQKRVIESILEKIYDGRLELITKKHVEGIMNLLNGTKANATLNLPANIVIQKEYSVISFIKNKKANKNYPKLTENEVVKLETVNNYNNQIIKIVADSTNKSNNVIRLNSQELNLPLYIRVRKPGDKMQVKHMTGSKKIKDIFIDEKMPLQKRNARLIVVDAKNEIVWLPGVKKSKFDKEINEKYDIILMFEKEGDKYE
ncbi:MAG: tRNA lysidine(34) synthetase TilS [bacterium]|nr:tRNA lysidine(34) synthetase TilS [bacterium]